MKQTDKEFRKHIKETARKSHSQNPISKSNVRASEEDKSFCLHNKEISTSSVPYTPLTKWTYLTDKRDVLSALNGLRNDDETIYLSLELFSNSKRLDSNDKKYILNIIKKLKENKYKWFPIINEVKKE